MKEKTYSCPCPVHGQTLATKRTKSVRAKDSGTVYTKPIFYCERCKAYYIFVDEFKSDFRAKVLADSGLPIYIRGKYIADVEKKQNRNVEKQATTNVSKKNNQKKKEPITRKIEDGLLNAKIIPSGKSVPKTCMSCGNETCNLIYIVKDDSGKQKKLVGKECFSCGEIFYAESIYTQHIGFFANSGGNKVSTDIQVLLKQYLKTKNKNSMKNIRKELVSINEDIDPILRNYLSSATKEEKERILYVAVRRSPEKFLQDLWEEYGDDKVEFSNKIEPFDFYKDRFNTAALNSIGVISPYPKALLNKLSGDKRAQYLIRDEMEKGYFSLDYIKFVSANREIILEPWIQDELQRKVREDGINLDYAPYLDLNSRPAINLINSIDDMAIINYIFQKNIWGVDEKNICYLSRNAEVVFKVKNNEELDEATKLFLMEYFRTIIQNPQNAIKKAQTYTSYIKLLFVFANSINVLQVLDSLYLALSDIGLNLEGYEDILAGQKSEVIFMEWLRRIDSADLTKKHWLAKRILMNYPEKTSELTIAVQKSGDVSFINNVKKMAEDLRLQWRMEIKGETSAASVNESAMIAEASKKDISESGKGREDKQKINNESDHKANEASSEDVFTDDFGNEFDFTELKHLLDL